MVMAAGSFRLLGWMVVTVAVVPVTGPRAGFARFHGSLGHLFGRKLGADLGRDFDEGFGRRALGVEVHRGDSGVGGL